VLVRAEVFQQVTADDGYFMYFEDVEFCHRARKLDEIVHNPSRVLYLRGGSSPVKNKLA
jgi:GT2 family glycosyltransferase